MRICEWLYNFRGYGCSEKAAWQAPCLMEDGSMKIWRLCDVHKQEVEKLLSKAGVPSSGWQPLPSTVCLGQRHMPKDKVR